MTNTITFIFAELALLGNVIVWALVPHQLIGSAVAAGLMACTWQLYRWSRP